MKTTSAPANMNMAWAELIVRELDRLGVDTFYVAPGSRSSPLALAIAAHAAHAIVHVDERGAAYAAIGYARATGKPAVVVTTSGTAVANLGPAVCEASLDAVPLLLLTADRPPELRETGANQTMTQPGIFSLHTRWQFDLPCPDARLPASFLLGTIDYAVFRATAMHPGPVHLNQMFREPLAPVKVADGARAWMTSVADWRASGRPWTTYDAPTEVASWTPAAPLLASARRGIIVVGALSGRGQAASVLAWAERLGWPVLPDIRSGLRLHRDHPAVISMIDHVLLSTKTARALKPDVILHIGGRITSKRLHQWIVSSAAPLVMINDTPARIDPDHHVAVRLTASLDASSWPVPTTRTTAAWRRRWKKLDHAVQRCWTREKAATRAITEPWLAAAVSGLLPAHHGLMVANSMPIRDMEMFGMTNHEHLTLAANRGVSGIDGNVATAAGFAEGLRQPVTLVIGDLALLHDLNSLSLVRTSPYPVIIVAVNNDGGGIFSFLPVGEVKHHFETCFGTPHGLRFEGAASMFGLTYDCPRTSEEFMRVYRKALSSKRSHLIEVTTERSANLREHRRIQAILRDALETLR